MAKKNSKKNANENKVENNQKNKQNNKQGKPKNLNINNKNNSKVNVINVGSDSVNNANTQKVKGANPQSTETLKSAPNKNDNIKQDTVKSDSIKNANDKPVPDKTTEKKSDAVNNKKANPPVAKVNSANPPVAKTKRAKTNQPKTTKSKLIAFLKGFIGLAIFFVILGLISANFVLNSLKSNTIEVTENNFWQSQSTATVYNSSNKQIGRLTERYVQWTDICRDPKEGEELTATNTLPLCEENKVASVSPYYINALVATEDQGFMDHNGVNYKGMFRAASSAIMNGDTSGGGGSSITMQLAKLLYLQNVSMYDAEGNLVTWVREDQPIYSYDMDYEDGLKYKLSQMALALKIEEKFSKHEIMENYVNTMWFGDGGYGIYNASKYFYNVNPEGLTIAQAATLAGMTQLPYEWDPYTNPEGTTTRRNTVIDRMLSEEYITAEEAQAAKDTNISEGLVDHSGDGAAEETQNRYYNDVNLYVKRELEKLLGTNADLNAGEMKIHTTIDDQLQKRTIDILDTSKSSDYYYPHEGTQTGTAMIDIETGGILAIGNGFDGQSEYAYAYNEIRNPGSTSKPLVDYAPVIEYLGWSTAHNYVDKTTYYTGTSFEVQNYTLSHVGNITMMKALASSTNTTAVQSFQAVVNEIGLEGMTAWFDNIGLKNWRVGREEENPQVYEAYALGAFGTTPVEMASAYATFANGGVYNEPHVIEYIEFSEQSPYYEKYGPKWYPEYDTHKAMEPSTAFMISQMLDPTVSGAISSPGDVYELDIALKTGTSNWGPNNFGIPELEARDRWGVGFSPDVATAVWYGYTYENESKGMYFPDLRPVSLQIFRALMLGTVYPDNPKLADGAFVQPDNVVAKNIKGETHYFISGSSDLTLINTPPNAPTVNISTDSKNVNISWDKVSNADSYNVLIDGNIIDKINGTSKKVTFDQLFAVGCKSSYEIGVQTIGTNGLKSSVTTYTVSNNVANCKEPEPEPEPVKKPETTKPDTTKPEDSSEE